jgi:hypothetical protein
LQQRGAKLLGFERRHGTSDLGSSTEWARQQRGESSKLGSGGDDFLGTGRCERRRRRGLRKRRSGFFFFLFLILPDLFFISASHSIS